MHSVPSNATVGKNVGDTERAVSIALGAGMVAAGFRHGSMGGALTALLGGMAIHRGITGSCGLYKAMKVSTACTAEHKAEEVKIEQTISVRRPRREVYQFWRKLENLVQFMPRLKKVQVEPDGRSHWEAKGPFGKTFSWDARVINEVENELLAWRSLPESELSNAGTVRFEDGGDGVTHVRVTMAYTPPGGSIGEALAEFLGDNPKQLLQEDLTRFRNLMEEKPSEPGHVVSKDGVVAHSKKEAEYLQSN